MTLNPMSVDNMLKLDITGLDTAQQNLGALYPEARRLGVQKADDKLIELLLRIEVDVPYRYVSWDQIGGFVSLKQQRFVMARIADGTFTPGEDTRSGQFPISFERVGTPPDETVVNTLPYGPWLMGVGEVARMHIMQGWPDIVEWLNRHEDEIRAGFESGVQQAINDLNLASEAMTQGGFGL